MITVITIGIGHDRPRYGIICYDKQAYSEGVYSAFNVSYTIPIEYG